MIKPIFKKNKAMKYTKKKQKLKPFYISFNKILCK